MALVNLRNALMTRKRLPYDAEVEYLESTGTQWIETGIVPDENTGMRLLFVHTSTNDEYIAGLRESSGNTRWCISETTHPYFGYRIIYLSTLTPRVLNETLLNYNNDGKGVINAGGSSITHSLDTLGFTPTLGIRLFGAKGSSSIQSQSYTKANARIYSARITQGSTLIRDYIPVRKGTTGYLYDRVSGKLFGNAGTGAFVLGPDVVPVEWIQQTGTQYIDTLYPMADTRREVITVDWSGHSTTYRELMAGAASGSYLIEMSPTGYYGTSPTNLSSIQVSQKDRIRWDYTVGSAPSLYINDVFAINDTLVRVPTGNVMTGGVGSPDVNFPKTKIYGLNIFTDADEQVRKMLPVRVGTEGAMMDVLTRRIYRNAGTGAFTYGNDLPYPIPAA